MTDKGRTCGDPLCDRFDKSNGKCTWCGALNKRCGTCGEEIRPDPLTGTSCACAGDIPADVMRAAGDAIIAGGRAYRIGDGFHRSIARAILAERERCAKRAEGLDRQGREWVPDSLWENIKRDTAAAIRRSDSEA